MLTHTLDSYTVKQTLEKSLATFHNNLLSHVTTIYHQAKHLLDFLNYIKHYGKINSPFRTACPYELLRDIGIS